MNAQTITNEARELAKNRAQAEAQLGGMDMLGALLNNEWNAERAREYAINAGIDNNPPTGADDLADLLTDAESAGLLSIEIERTVRIVLCTGGPHCEIQWPEDGPPRVVCYGWFGAGRYERQLTHNELTGFEAVVGDWDSLIESQS